MIESFWEELVGSLPLFGVIVKSIEVHGYLITFTDFVLTYLGVLCQNVILALRSWALEPESLLKDIREPLHIISRFKSDKLLMLLTLAPG